MLQEITTDVLVVGAGPAGLTVAQYIARANKKVVVLSGKSPSHILKAHKVENYPGVPSIAGQDLLATMRQQAVDFGAQIIESDALELGLGFDPKMITSRTHFIIAKAVVLAIGKGDHQTSIPDEEQYVGKGLSYCAICDGSFYKGKKVAVYGADAEARHDAEYLTELGCQTTFIDSSVTKITALKGDVKLTHITVNGEEVAVDGLFVIQAVSGAKLLANTGIVMGEKDTIQVDQKMQTNIPGVYAVGDITGHGAQVAVATGQGTIAALDVLKYIRQII